MLRHLIIIQLKPWLLFIFLILFFGLSISNAKTNTNDGDDPISKKTYALIVGISNYADPDIPKLKFAHIDAINFKEYLIATGVDSSHTTMLLNEEATRANIIMAFHKLSSETAQKGDRIYFYFSGHGDVESSLVLNPGYLLPNDSPSKLYALGALDVGYIENLVINASSRGVQCVLIVDACHAGKLAGGQEGSKRIQNVLGAEWEDEIKILSCQPGEFSREGIEWGNGRGVFSYIFINGLAGDADNDKDEFITLNELSIYLNQKVPEAAKPIPQYPVVRGNLQTVLSKVNRNYLTSLSKNKEVVLSKVNLKGSDAALLKDLDDTTISNYRNFNSYLDNGVTINNNSLPSAYYYYKQIPDSPSTKVVKELMKHNLGAELMNSMNSKLNKLVDNTKIIYDKNEFEVLALQGVAIREVLGDSLLRSLGFLANAIFQESLVGLLNRTNYPVKELAIKKLDTCIALNPFGSHFYYMRGEFYLLTRQYDLAIQDERKALNYSPTFLMPYLIQAAAYSELGKTDTAISILKKILELDTTFTYTALNGISLQFLRDKKYVKSIKYFQKARRYNNNLQDRAQRIDNDLFMAYSCYQLGMIKKAIYFYNRVSKADKTNCTYPLLISYCHSILHNKHRSLKYFERALKCGRIDQKQLDNEPDLDYIRDTDEYKELLLLYSKK